MARTARLLVPNCAYHVVHHGYDNEPVFVSHDDYAYYLDNLSMFKTRFDCRIYAYCLTPARVELLIDPGGDTDNLSGLIKRMAGRQARYINRRDARDGRLWEGRFRSSPVSPTYVLPCSRYIELAPLGARLARNPDRYPWSSYSARMSRHDDFIDIHPAFREMGECEHERARRYRDYVQSGPSTAEWLFIRTSLNSGIPIGEPAFHDQIQSLLGRSVAKRPRGRPRKSGSTK